MGTSSTRPSGETFWAPPRPWRTKPDRYFFVSPSLRRRMEAPSPLEDCIMSIRFRSWPFVVVFALAAGVALAQAPAGAAGAKKPDLPLVAGRKAEFTTTRGTWMSLDVSPDGQTLVFDLLGDLYTLPIGGGKATRLTSGFAYDAQPRWSPDGKRIVYLSDRSGGDNLWIMSADGRDTVQLTKGNDTQYISPEWTPDGKYIVASKAGGLFSTAKLWLYHTDGGTGMALITAPPQLKTVGAAF